MVAVSEPDVMADSGGKRIEVVTTAFDVIEALRAEGPLSAAEVAERVGRSKSTAYYHLRSLRDYGYVRATDDGYVLDLGFLPLGGAVLAEFPSRDVVESHVDELAAEAGHAAFFAVPHDTDAVFVAESRGGRADVDASLGTATPLHASAYGKAILAVDADRFDRVLDQGCSAVTTATLTAEGGLRDQLSDIDDIGIAFDDEETWPDVRSVATPVVADDVVGSVGITAPADSVADPVRHSKARRYDVESPSAVKRAARAIENELADRR